MEQPGGDDWRDCGEVLRVMTDAPLSHKQYIYMYVTTYDPNPVPVTYTQE